MKPIAIGYIRVSTTEQAEEGVSLDAQRHRIEAWAAREGYELVHIYHDDGISAARIDTRPGALAAIADCTARRGTLVVYSLSRLSRNLSDSLEIWRNLKGGGCNLVSLSESLPEDSAVGRLMYRMLAMLAEFERELIAERTKAGMQQLRREGRRAGGIPYGWDLAADGSTLTENASEQEALRLADRMLSGGASLGEVIRELEALGHKPKKAAQWSRGSLLKVMRSYRRNGTARATGETPCTERETTALKSGLSSDVAPMTTSLLSSQSSGS